MSLFAELKRRSVQCGVPFDLDATPNFEARLEESALPSPPPDLIAGLRRGMSGAQ